MARFFKPTPETLGAILELMMPGPETVEPALARLSQDELQAWQRRIMAREGAFQRLPLSHPAWRVLLYLRAVKKVAYRRVAGGGFAELSLQEHWRMCAQQKQARKRTKAKRAACPEQIVIDGRGISAADFPPMPESGELPECL